MHGVLQAAYYDASCALCGACAPVRACHMAFEATSLTCANRSLQHMPPTQCTFEVKRAQPHMHTFLQDTSTARAFEYGTRSKVARTCPADDVDNNSDSTDFPSWLLYSVATLASFAGVEQAMRRQPKSDDFST